MPDDAAGGQVDLEDARVVVEQRIAAIDAELAAVAELEAERQRLTEALTLLGRDTSRRGSARQSTRPPAAKKSAPRRARRPASGGSTRTRNRDLTVAFLKENPGVEAGAVVEHLGVSRGVTYNLLARLVSQGLVVREEAEGGRARYRAGDASPSGD